MAFFNGFGDIMLSALRNAVRLNNKSQLSQSKLSVDQAESVTTDLTGRSVGEEIFSFYETLIYLIKEGN